MLVYGKKENRFLSGVATKRILEHMHLSVAFRGIQGNVGHLRGLVRGGVLRGAPFASRKVSAQGRTLVQGCGRKEARY